MPQRLDAVLRVVDAGCSGAMTLAWPRKAANCSGVWPSLSGVVGLTSPPVGDSNHSLVPILSSTSERCSAVGIRFIEVDIVPSKQYFHHPLMTILSSTTEWCLVAAI